MPIFEYECPKCEAIVEKIHKISEDEPTTCEYCLEPMSKIISTVGWILKGKGFYKPSKTE